MATPVIEPQKNVLLLGEGDFSFALEYAKRHPGYRIFATEYANETMLSQRVSFSQNVRELKKLPNVTVLYGINANHGPDATKLDSDNTLRNHKFDKIIFNFPNTGERNGSTARLVKAFFQSARHVLNDGGKVQMGLVDIPRYDQAYQLHNAAHHRFKLKKAVQWGRRHKYTSYTHVSTNLDRRPKSNPLLKYTFEKVSSDDAAFDSEDEYFSDQADRYDGRLDHLKSVRRKSKKGMQSTPMTTHYHCLLIDKYKTWKNARQMAEQYEGLKQYQEALRLYRRLYRASQPHNREPYRIAYERVKSAYKK